jgi:hypothetical protein
MKEERAMKKKILLIGGGSALLFLCMLFGAFFAGPLLASAHSITTTSSAATTASTPCQQYQQNLANSLHVSTSTLHQDQVAAREAVVAQEVKDGQLTQAQANTIDKRLESNQACSGKHQGLRLQKGILRQTLKGEQSTLLGQIASGLHLSTTQLQSDLQQGQTLNQIAKAQKVTKSQLHTIVLNAANAALSQAQKAGTITAAQESQFTTYLKNHPGVVNRWLHHDFASTKK